MSFEVSVWGQPGKVKELGCSHFLVACEAELTISVGGLSLLKRYAMVWGGGKWVTILPMAVLGPPQSRYI